jgi:hypothetical protein
VGVRLATNVHKGKWVTPFPFAYFFLFEQTHYPSKKEERAVRISSHSIPISGGSARRNPFARDEDTFPTRRQIKNLYSFVSVSNKPNNDCAVRS